jgi:hypothetical protein
MIVSTSKEALNDTSIRIEVNQSRPYIENTIEALRHLDFGSESLNVVQSTLPNFP